MWESPLKETLMAVLLFVFTEQWLAVDCGKNPQMVTVQEITELEYFLPLP
jgi:hypothetical protein